MIITVPKPFDEVLAGLEPYGSVFVVGCAACAAKCGTGGDEAVAALSAELVKRGKTIAGSIILDTPCDTRIARRDIGRSAAVSGADAVLVLACGAGVQSLSSVCDRPLIPGLNPVFVGTVERIGVYDEFCSVCGECMLAETGGICPKTRCAKGLVNGPCGGVVEGKCEVDSSRDCAWALIAARAKKTGLKDPLAAYRPPRITPKPRHVEAPRKGRSNE